MTRTTGRENWRRSPLTIIITSTAKCSYRWVRESLITPQNSPYLRPHSDAPNFKNAYWPGGARARARAFAFIAPSRRETPASSSSPIDRLNAPQTVAEKSIVAREISPPIPYMYIYTPYTENERYGDESRMWNIYLPICHAIRQVLGNRNVSHELRPDGFAGDLNASYNMHARTFVLCKILDN